MDAVNVVTGTAVPLDRSDVDTDQIIPSDWLKRVERTGFGRGLFSEWRDDRDFVLNDEQYAGASILVAGPNFGTGSSREHAVWAIQDYGFRAVISPRFADIFRNNATKCGLVPVQVEAAVGEALMRAVEADLRQVVPLAGNEGAIGHDLLQDQTRNKEALLARDSGKLTLAGPFDLMQVGLGAVARLPVFLDDKQGVPAFWGFTTVLIRFPQVLDKTLLSGLTARGFGYHLWRIHPDSGKKHVITESVSFPLLAAVGLLGLDQGPALVAHQLLECGRIGLQARLPRLTGPGGAGQGDQRKEAGAHGAVRFFSRSAARMRVKLTVA